MRSLGAFELIKVFLFLSTQKCYNISFNITVRSIVGLFSQLKQLSELKNVVITLSFGSKVLPSELSFFSFLFWHPNSYAGTATARKFSPTLANSEFGSATFWGHVTGCPPCIFMLQKNAIFHYESKLTFCDFNH